MTRFIYNDFVYLRDTMKIGIVKDFKQETNEYLVEFSKETMPVYKYEEELEPVKNWQEIMTQWNDLFNEALQIDKEIYNVITAFNKLGLQTKYSCSGHEDGMDSFYIMFHEDVNEKLLHEWFKKFTLGNVIRTGKLHLNKWYRWNNLVTPPEYMENYTLQFNSDNEQLKKQLWNEIVWSLKLMLYEKTESINSK